MPAILLPGHLKNGVETGYVKKDKPFDFRENIPGKTTLEPFVRVQL